MLLASLKNLFKRRHGDSKSGLAPDENLLRYKLGNWLLTAPRATSLLGLTAILAASLTCLIHIHLNAETLFGVDENETALVFVYLRGFYFLALGLLFPVLVLCFLRHRITNLFITASIASSAVFVVWAASEILLWQPSSHLYHSGIAPAKIPEYFRYLLCTGLILSPPLLVVLYRRASIMDRYVLRNFLGPFLLCSIGILAVWIIYDLQDNGSDFFEARASFGTVLHLYIVQLPQMIVMILPATLLLGILYSLSKMSKSNEIVSMLSSGRSLLRIIKPLLFIGLYSSIFCFALNYEWAPQAAAAKDSILNDIDEQRRINKKSKKKRKTIVKSADIALARNQVYPNREANRLWRIRYIPLDLSQKKMSVIEIIERDDKGRLTKAIYAEKAGWNHLTGEWFLRSSSQNQVKIFDYTTDHKLPTETLVEEHIEQGWSETPWNIVSEHLVADHLGIPDLGFHLKANVDKSEEKLAPFRAHWHYRWALPWNCMVVVLFAAPLGIGLSRRGVLGGVFGAILLFFSLVFLSHLFLVLGQSQIMSPFFSAWTTNILLAAIGIYLIYMRSANKDIPKLTPAGIVAIFRSSRNDPPPSPRSAPVLTEQSKPLRSLEQELTTTSPQVAQRPSRSRRTTAVTSERRRASEVDLDFD
ncbi:MAG: LPS export ABC transporter permease LptG [Verrucomicrobiales bacterium]